MGRKYNVSDSVILESANTTLENLDEDITTFSDFDPDLNEDKMNELEDTIEAAFDIGTNESVKAEMKTYTQTVNEAMKNCQDLVSNIRYFSSKAFGKNPAVYAQFGLKEYSKIRNKQDKLIVWFTRLDKVVSKYREQLLSSGAKEETLDNVKPFGETLMKANAEQEQFIQSQPVQTSERDKIFNQLHDIMLAFSDAAEFVFKDDSARRSLYALPRNSSSSPSGAENDRENLV